MTKKITALILITSLICSYIAPALPARAAEGDPPVITKVYLRTETDPEGNSTIRYIIQGQDFYNPIVSIGSCVEIVPDYYNVGLIIIERNPDINDAFEEGLKTIVVRNSDGQQDSYTFEVVNTPYITAVAPAKVYVGDPLDITGTGFTTGSTPIEKVYVAGTEYQVGAEAQIVSDSKIHIPVIKAPITTGPSDIKVVRDAPGADSPDGAIEGVLKGGITVVGKLTDIEVVSLEPDAGSVNGGTIIRMIGAEGKRNFQSNMKVYIGGTESQHLASDVQLIKDENGNVIGLQARTPPGQPGPQEVIIRDATEQNEYLVPFYFTYLQADNALLVEKVTPSYAKETEQKAVEIIGRNIVTINIDGVTQAAFNQAESYYDSVNKEYIARYTGTYNGQPVDIIRKIKLTVGAIAPITDIPLISVDEDRLQANTPIVTLDPQEPKQVDVVVNTDTVVTLQSDGSEQLHRVEEYVLQDAFTYYPAKTIPGINSITPDRGPYDRDIYITIEGVNFQVLVVEENGQEVVKYPVVRIGNKIIDPNSRDADDPPEPEPDPDYVLVYDSQGNPIDGKKYTLGTVIRTRIPAEPHGDLGFVDVTVTNPDMGTSTVPNMFEFKQPDRLPSEFPQIYGLEPNKGPIDGGTEVVIYGKNFDYALNGIRVTVTIDGAKAEVLDVKNTGDRITILTPPGTEGYKTVQVINEDGSMAELVDGFYYTRVNSAPVIDSIAPDYGGEGTQVIIRGYDFRLPDPGSAIIDKKIGTRVLFDGQDINDYLLDGDGNILVDPATGEVLFQEGGRRVEVLDEYTIRITVPPDLPIGPKDVTVLNPDTASYTVEEGFYYKSPASQPRITDINGDGNAITPSEGSVAGGTVVTIEGSDFREGIRVFFGGIEASDVTVNGDGNIIQATTPRYYITEPGVDSEKVDVTLVNYDGGSCTESEGFTYRIPGSEPVITKVEPAQGTTAGEDTVIIWGQDFRREDSNGDGIYDRFPRVYFGGVEALDVEWGNYNMLLVTTPSYPEEGKVDVILVNPDAGTCTLKNGFEYRRSSPSITSVTPDRGTKKGSQEITIRGTGFIKGDLSENLDGELVNRHISPENPIIDLLVVFGDETDSAPISGGKSEVIVGSIRVVYDSTVPGEDSTKLYLIPPAGEDLFITSYNIIPGKYHLFIINGPEDLGDDTIGDEGIKVEVSGNTLTVTRRVAPYARWIDGNTLVVKTPPVDYIGERNLYVINKDGGTAAASFEYTNPASDPRITDIRPAREVYDTGGNLVEYLTEASVDDETFITIEGSDFRAGVEVFIGESEAEVISRSNEDDMIIARVPPGDSSQVNQKMRIVVVNQDGGSADSSLLPVPRWFVYRIPESQPFIEAVYPDKTSAAGGNTIRIVGYDFRPGAKVLIGGREALNINVVSYDEITAETPEGLQAGKHDVQVINTDFGTCTLEDAITVVSNPVIDYITDQDGIVIGSLSFLGGERVILKGSGFQQGLRVIFGGEVKYLAEAEDEQGIEGINSRDERVKVVGGREASEVEVQDGNTVSLVTPSGVEGDINLVVVNPDGGISNLYSLEYVLPLPKAPGDLDATLVYDRYVRLEWPAVEDALYYEIYVSEKRSGPYHFIESTTDTVYYITKLDSDTRYYFKVRAVNKYGSSSFTGYDSITTEDTEEEDRDGKLLEKGSITVSGNRAVAAVGIDDYEDSKLLRIDLTGSNYRVDIKEVVIPAEVIRKSDASIHIDTDEMGLRVYPRVFRTYSLYRTKDDEKDIFARLKLGTVKGSQRERGLKYIPRGKRMVSEIISFSFEIQKGREINSIQRLSYYGIDAEFRYRDSQLLGTKEDSIRVYRFDQVSGQWQEISSSFDPYFNRIYCNIIEEGYYALMGEW